MSVLIVFIIIILMLFLALYSPPGFIYLILLVGGIPISLLTGPAIFLETFGGLNSQALFLFAVFLAVLLIVIINLQKATLVILKHNIYLLFCFFAMLSLFWSNAGMESLRSYVKYVFPFIFYVMVVVSLANNFKKIKVVEIIIYLAAISSIAIAILNVFSGGLFGPVKQTYGVLGLHTLAVPYMSPANFSFFLLVPGFLALSKWLQDKDKLSLVVYIVISMSVILAFVRIGILSYFVGSIIVYFLLSKNNLFKVLVSSALLFVVVSSFFYLDQMKERMFYDPNTASYLDIINDPDKFISNLNTSGRLELWESASREFKDSDIVLGSGSGSVDAWLGRYGHVNALHSDFYRLFLDLGLTGLIIYLAAIFQLIYVCVRSYKLGFIFRVNDAVIYSVVSIASIVTMLITMLTDNTLNYATEFGVYVYGVSALSYIHYRRMLAFKKS
ncbi:MAG: O-antigen ligase family protein [Gammaproteobacteria bacterium]|nr:O-antigen ligase family protein [Gammaproteobacteria bacterium]